LEAKCLLQIAAVVGKDVPLEVLQPLASLAPEALHEALNHLERAELLHQTRPEPQPEYTFKHALTHQVAYESLLRERRRAAHVQLVELIERLHADHIEEQVERLAHHAVGAALWDKAVHYLYRSAKRAIQRSAHQQAIRMLERGLAIVEALPDANERRRQELQYRKSIGVVMMAARGWAADEVLDAYTRAQVLCEELGDERELFIALRGEGQSRMIRGESARAAALGERCSGLAARTTDVGVQIETHHLYWTNSFFLGKYTEAAAHCAQGMALYRHERDHDLTFTYSGHDPGVCCRCFAGLIRCLQGFPDQSLVLCGQALELAGQFGHPLTTALAYWSYSYAHLLRREPEGARRWAEREIAVCDEFLLPLLRSHGTFQLVWAMAQ